MKIESTAYTSVCTTSMRLIPHDPKSATVHQANIFIIITIIVIILGSTTSSPQNGALKDCHQYISQSPREYGNTNEGEGYYEVTSFKKILNCRFFVDKTEIIRDIFQHSHSFMVITAPKGFGKSTILDMIKTFLEIIVDKNGLLFQDVTLTNNYKLFMNQKKKLNIASYPNFVKEHLGQHPIIYVDLNTDGPITTLGEWLDVLGQVLHETFKKHTYLSKSRNLDEHEIKRFNSYIVQEKDSEFNENDILKGLHTLSELLFKHFKKKVIVLVDDFDSPITKCLSAEGLSIEIVVGKLCAMLRSVFKGNAMVNHGLISGVYFTPGLNLISGITNLQFYGFLEKHKFNKYYGLTPNEVEKLFNKSEINKETRAHTHDWFSGYTISEVGTNMYSTGLVMNYLQGNKFNNEWEKIGYTNDFENVFRVSAVRNAIDKLMLGKPISVRVRNSIWLSDLQILRNVNLHSVTYPKRPDTDFLLSFLLNQGYLAYTNITQDNEGMHYLRIPNKLIEKKFKLEQEKNPIEERTSDGRKSLKTVWEWLKSFL